MLEIIQLTPHFVRGGGEKIAVQLHEGLTQRGLNSTIIGFVDAPPPHFDKAYSLGQENPYGIRTFIRLTKQLRVICGAPGFKCLVHCHMTPAQLFGPYASYLCGRGAVLVTTEHSTSNRRRSMWGGRAFDHMLLAPFQGVACISEGVQKAVSGRIPYVASRSRVIYNGIDLSRFNRVDQEPARSETLEIVSIGRLTPAKNYPMAIKAISALRHLPIHYTIVGDGEERKTLQQLIDNGGLAGHVRLAGQLNDVTGILSSASIFLMPSLWEGFGIAALEAMACQLPVVASHVSGLREVVGQNGECALLTNPESADDISHAIQTLVESAELRKKLGQRGHERAQRFALNRMIDEYVNFYYELADQANLRDRRGLGRLSRTMRKEKA
jgi:glycosyltransferase involved in cell wall biosynthesis